jgi:hypothetical protein
MKTVWLKRGDRYESVRLLREYPEVGAVKVLRVGSPEPWTFKASEIVTEKPLTKRQREGIIKRQVREERETAQREQVKDVLFDGKPKSIMEIVDAVNAMPRAMTRMEPARAWKIVSGFVKNNTHTAELQVTTRSRHHWIVQRISPKPL